MKFALTCLVKPMPGGRAAVLRSALDRRHLHLETSGERHQEPARQGWTLLHRFDLPQFFAVYLGGHALEPVGQAAAGRHRLGDQPLQFGRTAEDRTPLKPASVQSAGKMNEVLVGIGAHQAGHGAERQVETVGGVGAQESDAGRESGGPVVGGRKIDFKKMGLRAMDT